MKRSLLLACASVMFLTSCGGDSGTNSNGNGGQTGGDPKLTQIGFIPIYGASGVFVTGNNAYVVADSGFYIVDVSNPANPTQRSFLGVKTPFSHAADVFVAGTTAYVANYNSGLVTVDVSDPANPDSLTQWVNGDLECRNVQVTNSYAYLAYEDSGLVILNVSNPANPVLTGRIRIPALDLALIGSTLQVLCMGDTLLRTYSITSPGNLAQTCAVPKSLGEPAVLGIGASSELTAVAIDNWNDWTTHGLKLITPNCGAAVAQATPGYTQNVVATGIYAVVADYGTGIRVYKYASGSAPAQIDFVATPSHPDDMFVTGDYLYVTDDDSGAGQQGLYIFRFAAP